MSQITSDVESVSSLVSSSLGGALSPPGKVVPEPYVHFDNFYFSIVTIFVVISGENWNDVYFTAYQVSSP